MEKKKTYVYSAVNKDIYGISIVMIGEKLELIKTDEDGSVAVVTRHGFYLRMKPDEYYWGSEGSDINYRESIRKLADELYTLAFKPVPNNPVNGVDKWRTIINDDNHLIILVDNDAETITIKKVEDL